MALKQLFPNIWQWSWFSEEKRLDFNGLCMFIGEHRVLVDPPLMAAEDLSQIRRQGAVDYIVVTNRDHIREALRYREEFRCQLYVPAADAAEMSLSADRLHRDGELLPGGLWVVQLEHQKSSGESALFLQQGKGILILGDALIGNPPGQLSLLAAEKYRDPARAKDGLRRLLKYTFDAVLVGDGTAILSGAKQAVERALS